MGNISRDTFNKLKHYVSVRLQQGVPLVDADWNEMDDIRRFELRAFLKWFVGNGVPAGNDGFLITHLNYSLGLSAKLQEPGLSSLEIDLVNSTAAKILGFGSTNYKAQRLVTYADTNKTILTPGAQLTTKLTESLTKGLLSDKTLVIILNASSPRIITFKDESNLEEVVNTINIDIPDLAWSGKLSDFDIAGGDGTDEDIGRCLVDGWDVLNECSLRYASQALYNNEYLANLWKVDVLPELKIKEFTDSRYNFYLDVWEREVSYGEDPDLVNEHINVETCIRYKREWVVRCIAQGNNIKQQAGHAYYDLAEVNIHSYGYYGSVVNEVRNHDLRRLIKNDYGIEIGQLATEIRQLATDSFGANYTLDRAGSPWPGISLRDAVNAAMWGRLPTTPERIEIFPYASISGRISLVPSLECPHDEALMVWVQNQKVMIAWVSQIDGMRKRERVTIDNANEDECVALRDGNTIWVFWRSDRDNPGKEWRIFSRRYTSEQGGGQIEAVPNSLISNSSQSVLSAFRDSGSRIWLTWVHSDGLLRMSRYVNGSWSDPESDFNHPVSGYGGSITAYHPAVVEGQNGTVLLFWRVGSSYSGKIWYRRYELGTGNSWQKGVPARLTYDESYSEEFPVPLRDGAGSVWLFWKSSRQIDRSSFADFIFYKRFGPTGYSYGYDAVQLVKSSWIAPILFDAQLGHISVFWEPGGDTILYKNYDARNDKWSDIADLPGGSLGTQPLVAIADGVGGGWLVKYASVGDDSQLVFKKVYSRL